MCDKTVTFGFYSPDLGIDTERTAVSRCFQNLSDLSHFNIKIFVKPCSLLLFVRLLVICLQCFDTVGWASGRASGL